MNTGNAANKQTKIIVPIKTKRSPWIDTTKIIKFLGEYMGKCDDGK